MTFSEMTPKQIQRCGFIKDAGSEFWYLGNYLLKIGQDATELPFEGNSGPEAEGISIFRELLRMAGEFE